MSNKPTFMRNTKEVTTHSSKWYVEQVVAKGLTDEQALAIMKSEELAPAMVKGFRNEGDYVRFLGNLNQKFKRVEEGLKFMENSGAFPNGWNLHFNGQLFQSWLTTTPNRRGKTGRGISYESILCGFIIRDNEPKEVRKNG